jgi:acyl-CoA reductase-like NAD-dependent aldehyde dehydrogenase
VRSALGKTFGVADPATGKEYAQVAVGIAGDVNQAVLAAQTALATGPWPGMAASDRASVLRGIADAIDSRAGDIAAAEALGSGLPVTQAREQATQAGELFRLAADLITVRAAADASLEPGGPGYVMARPAGVAGLITSWRTPFLAQARAAAPALAAGCTVVLKPDELAPLPAMLLAEITTAAGLPDGVRVTPFDTDEEAISIANAVTGPATAYMWTSDPRRAQRLAPAIASASTWVNSHNPQDCQAAIASHGPGRPGAEAGQVSIDFYTQSRTVLIGADDTPVPRFGS